MATLPHNCDRARAWVSLKLDGELSELEGFMLGSHLERCEACRAFAADAVGVTNALRTASLEPLERPVSLPGGRRVMRRRALQFGAAAALVAASVGLGSLFGAVGPGRAHAPSPPEFHSQPVVLNHVPISLDSEARGLPQVPAVVRTVRQQGLTLTRGDF